MYSSLGWLTFEFTFFHKSSHTRINEVHNVNSVTVSSLWQCDVAGLLLLYYSTVSTFSNSGGF